MPSTVERTIKCLLYVYCQVEADLARAQQEVKLQLSSQRPIDRVVYRSKSDRPLSSIGGAISADASSVISAIQSMGGVAPGGALGMLTT